MTNVIALTIPDGTDLNAWIDSIHTQMVRHANHDRYIYVLDGIAGEHALRILGIRRNGDAFIEMDICLDLRVPVPPNVEMRPYAHALGEYLDSLNVSHPPAADPDTWARQCLKEHTSGYPLEGWIYLYDGIVNPHAFRLRMVAREYLNPNTGGPIRYETEIELPAGDPLIYVRAFHRVLRALGHHHDDHASGDAKAAPSAGGTEAVL